MSAAKTSSGKHKTEGAFCWPRSFLNNRFVYLVLSQRAHGLSIGINANPDKYCNFKCVYCEVDRTRVGADQNVDIPIMAAELEAMLNRVQQNGIAELPEFSQWPADLLRLREVALSGDGEPTLSPQFLNIVREIVGMRSRGRWGLFKIVLITNTAGLPTPEVREGLRLLHSNDEIWVKLEAGTQEYMDKVNGPNIGLPQVIANILSVARERPVVIQSLFPLIRGEEPAESEILQYVHRLAELKAAGARIALVQIYSAHRQPQGPDCGHLPLATLSRIARHVRTFTGLKAQVF